MHLTMSIAHPYPRLNNVQKNCTFLIRWHPLLMWPKCISKITNYCRSFVIFVFILFFGVWWSLFPIIDFTLLLSSSSSAELLFWMATILFASSSEIIPFRKFPSISDVFCLDGLPKSCQRYHKRWPSVTSFAFRSSQRKVMLNFYIPSLSYHTVQRAHCAL